MYCNKQFIICDTRYLGYRAEKKKKSGTSLLANIFVLEQSFHNIACLFRYVLFIQQAFNKMFQRL